MPTEEELRSRVLAGAEFLDLHDPGWATRISREVRVASTHECLLAQLYGRYRTGFEKYKLTETESIARGFRADSRELEQKHQAINKYYSLLNQAWEVEVAKKSRPVVPGRLGLL